MDRGESQPGFLSAEAFGHDRVRETVTHNEDTLVKAKHALADSGLVPEQVENAVTALQNAGILLRERA